MCSKGVLPTQKEPKLTEQKELDMIGHWMLPYYPGLSEKISKIVHSAHIGVAYKTLHTICHVIPQLKDRISTGRHQE